MRCVHIVRSFEQIEFICYIIRNSLDGGKNKLKKISISQTVILLGDNMEKRGRERKEERAEE